MHTVIQNPKFRKKWAAIILFLLVVFDISTLVMSCIEIDFY